MKKTTFVILDTYTISSQTSNTTVATAANVAFAPLEKKPYS